LTEREYNNFRKILFDYGGFDPVLVHNCHSGKPYDFKLNKFRRISDFQQKYGSARSFLTKPENSKDWDEYYEFCHAVLKQEDRELFKIP